MGHTGGTAVRQLDAGDGGEAVPPVEGEIALLRVDQEGGNPFPVAALEDHADQQRAESASLHRRQHADRAEVEVRRLGGVLRRHHLDEPGEAPLPLRRAADLLGQPRAIARRVRLDPGRPPHGRAAGVVEQVALPVLAHGAVRATAQQLLDRRPAPLVLAHEPGEYRIVVEGRGEDPPDRRDVRLARPAHLRRSGRRGHASTGSRTTGAACCP